MTEPSIVHSLFLVFISAAVIATAALYTRQAMLLAYIVAGFILGPPVLDVISNTSLISDISNIGILFLLFLLGLNLELSDLKRLFSEAIRVTTISCLAFYLASFALAIALNFSVGDSIMLGLAMMFSSTIITLKLLPTSALHHQRMGELIVSILLLQDILAIIILIALHAFADSSNVFSDSLLLVVGLPALAFGCWWVATRLLVKLYERFDQIHEYLFLIAIAWCLGVSELAIVVGTSHEVGAFIAGVTLATSPIARFMAESLKPLRDFFLVLFFFALGASLNASSILTLIIPILCFALLSVMGKSIIFSWLLSREPKTAKIGKETGARLSQISEFSLLIIFVSLEHQLISPSAAIVIQSATILSFVLSSSWIVRSYPSPLAFDSKLRRD